MVLILSLRGYNVSLYIPYATTIVRYPIAIAYDNDVMETL